MWQNQSIPGIGRGIRVRERLPDLIAAVSKTQESDHRELMGFSTQQAIRPIDIRSRPENAA
jgi:hypothetical protein